MKYYLACFLFELGDIHSKFPDYLFYYPFYNWCMATSADLDTDGKIWKSMKDRDSPN